jgi:hypothetical protein
MIFITQFLKPDINYIFFLTVSLHYQTNPNKAKNAVCEPGVM